MKSFRRQRAAERIRRELTAILAEGVGGVELPSVYLDRVELAPDYSFARVIVAPAVPGAPVDDALAAPLRRAQGLLRGELARRVNLRKLPRLDFQIDRAESAARRIETLLERAKKRSKTPPDVVVLLVGFLAFGSSAWAETKLERFEAAASIMGGEFRIALYGERKGVLASSALAAFDEARRVDALISNYREDSELSRVNRLAASRPVEVSEEFFKLLANSVEYSRRTEGAFDLTVGPLMKAWGFYKGNGELPSARALRSVVERVGYRGLELDGARRAVRFAAKGMELDPGGIGKGYAVGRMADLLRRAGVEAAFISAGTSSMYAVGAPPGEPRGWRVRIRDPDDPDAVAAEIHLRDESLSTSGSYEKFFTVDGETYSHIMDPRTGRPAEGVASVSVRSPKALDSEVWTTALFVNGPEWARRRAPAEFDVFFCREDGECAWLEKR